MLHKSFPTVMQHVSGRLKHGQNKYLGGGDFSCLAGLKLAAYTQPQLLIKHRFIPLNYHLSVSAVTTSLGFSFSIQVILEATLEQRWLVYLPFSLVFKKFNLSLATG